MIDFLDVILAFDNYITIESHKIVLEDCMCKTYKNMKTKILSDIDNCIELL